MNAALSGGLASWCITIKRIRRNRSNRLSTLQPMALHVKSLAWKAPIQLIRSSSSDQ